MPEVCSNYLFVILLSSPSLLSSLLTPRPTNRGETRDSFKLKKENVFRTAAQQMWNRYFSRSARRQDKYQPGPPAAERQVFCFSPLPTLRGGGGLCRRSQKVADINSRAQSLTVACTWPPGSKWHALARTRPKTQLGNLAPVRALSRLSSSSLNSVHLLLTPQ